MTFSYDKFLRPISSGDRNIQIYNNEGVLVYTINPFSIVNTFVSNNLLKISLKSQRVITLDFLNSNLAKIALPLLLIPAFGNLLISSISLSIHADSASPYVLNPTNS